MDKYNYFVSSISCLLTTIPMWYYCIGQVHQVYGLGAESEYCDTVHDSAHEILKVKAVK